MPLSCLIYTKAGGSMGMGHLNRMLRLVERFKDTVNFDILLPVQDKKFISENNSVDFSEYHNLKIKKANETNKSYKFVISDCRELASHEFRSLNRLGPILSFDDLGKWNKHFAITIQTFPSLWDNNANFIQPGFIFLDKQPENEICAVKNRILITFGGSDPAFLTNQLLSFIFSRELQNSKELLNSRELGSLFIKQNIQVIIGPFFKPSYIDQLYCRFPGIDFKTSIRDLTPFIREADIIFTSFGLTLYESLMYDKYPILLNPSAYHEKLTKSLRYPFSLGFKKKNRRLHIKCADMLKAVQESRNFDSKKILFPYEDCTQVMTKIFFHTKIGSKNCPFCHSLNEKIFFRQSDFNIIRCRSCGLIFLQHLFTVRQNYKDEYFFFFFKTSYGKTYEEDREKITFFAKKRLEIIKSIIPKTDSEIPQLLDIGCALGFFLKAASDAGFRVKGLDVSDYAVNYVKSQFGFSVGRGDIQTLKKESSCFHVISMFYVLEHLENFDEYLSAVFDLLKPGGVLALATPNNKGISTIVNKTKFFSAYPEDHYVLFNPVILKKILKKHGFIIKKCIITGIHAQRFFRSAALKRICQSSSLFTAFIIIFAKLFCLGDTFEIYAVKK